MAKIFFPFDAGPGYDVAESEWALMARLWRATGVVRGELAELAVSADGVDMTVDVAAGVAWVRGFYFRSDAIETLTIADADPFDPRLDRVVVRLDRDGNTVDLDVLTGTPAVSPSPPALTQDDVVWEISLATVEVPANASAIAAGNVTDTRTLSTDRAVTSDTAPSSPSVDDLWYDSSVDLWKRWDGAAWVAAGRDTYHPATAVAARAYQATAQTLSASTMTVITLDAENFDTDGLHDNSTNNSRLTVPSDGLYAFIGQVAFESSSSSGARLARLRLNGAVILADRTLVLTTGAARISVGTVEQLTAGDYVELMGYQTAGTIDTAPNREYTFLAAYRIGD